MGERVCRLPRAAGSTAGALGGGLYAGSSRRVMLQHSGSNRLRMVRGDVDPACVVNGCCEYRAR